MLIDGPRRRGGDLALFLRLLLNVGNLLALLARRADLHSQDDVTDFRLREGGHIHVVLLSIVGQNHILEGELNLDPFFISQGWPNVMRLRDCRLIGLEDDFRLVRINMHSAHHQDDSGEGSVAGDCLEIRGIF